MKFAGLLEFYSKLPLKIRRSWCEFTRFSKKKSRMTPTLSPETFRVFLRLDISCCGARRCILMLRSCREAITATWRYFASYPRSNFQCCCDYLAKYRQIIARQSYVIKFSEKQLCVWLQNLICCFTVYRCCYNYDLCSRCERIIPPVHDPSHVLFKMSMPINDVKLDRTVLESVLSRSSGASRFVHCANNFRFTVDLNVDNCCQMLSVFWENLLGTV